MSEITMSLPERLRDAGNDCEALVAIQIDVAKREFANAEGDPGAARMGGMVSAGAARACIDGWQETFRDASKAMHALGVKLTNTAGIVVGADQDSATALYRGPVPELPDISVNLSE